MPSPFLATVSRGSTSTLRLSNFRSSGVMTFGCSSLPLPLLLWPFDGPGAFLFGCGRGRCGSNCTGSGSRGFFLGAGKFCFLSTASTSLLYFWKRASALISVDSRSIVLLSSLTAPC